jgi:glutamine synthetase
MTIVDRIREELERHDIKRIKVGGFDIDCILRGKYISLEKFWSALDGGIGFCDVIFGWDSGDVLYDRSKVTGWHSGYPDTPATIDLETLRIIPWEPQTAAFLLDFKDAKGQPLEVSPRQLLKKVLERTEAAGYAATMACEFEFFIYDETANSLSDKGYRGARPLSPGMFGYSWLRTSQSASLVHEIIDTMQDFDIAIEGFHTETGPGVFEAAIRYDDALTAADKAALFKTAMKEICHRHGLVASFMAKPATNLPGCSGHIHQSLWSKDHEKNLFFDAKGEHGMSALMQHYLAGQVSLMPELLALIAPNINSYKRLVPGTWAPTHATWGIDNRTCALRVIPGGMKSERIEYRLAAADINPYIAMAAALASGVYGIEKKLALPPPVIGNAYEAKDVAPLSSSLRTANEALDRSKIARELFGATFVDHYVMTREWECRQAERAVTDWELARYFELA